MTLEEQKIRYLIVNSSLTTKEKKSLLKYFNKIISQNIKLKEFYYQIRGWKNDKIKKL